jgi:hypothetical protein
MGTYGPPRSAVFVRRYSRRLKSFRPILGLFFATCSLAQQLPIIDMHVHAVAADFYYGQTGAADPFIGGSSPPTDDALFAIDSRGARREQYQ